MAAASVKGGGGIVEMEEMRMKTNQCLKSWCVSRTAGRRPDCLSRLRLTPASQRLQAKKRMRDVRTDRGDRRTERIAITTSVLAEGEREQDKRDRREGRLAGSGERRGEERERRRRAGAGR